MHCADWPTAIWVRCLLVYWPSSGPSPSCSLYKVEYKVMEYRFCYSSIGHNLCHTLAIQWWADSPISQLFTQLLLMAYMAMLRILWKAHFVCGQKWAIQFRAKINGKKIKLSEDKKRRISFSGCLLLNSRAAQWGAHNKGAQCPRHYQGAMLLKGG